MPGSLTLRKARLVLRDRVVTGDVLVADGVIEQVGPAIGRTVGEEIDAEGLVLLPGLVDLSVDLPLDDDGTALAKVTGEAVAAGVTATIVHDPRRPCVDEAGVRARLDFLARHSRTHHGVYAGLAEGARKPASGLERAAGVRVRLGRPEVGPVVPVEALEGLFEASPMLVVAEGQDPEGMLRREALYADPVDPAEHSRIYTPELAASVLRAVGLAARKHGKRAHWARLSSHAELEVLAELGDAHLTASSDVAHLFLRAPGAYTRLGVRAVCDPPVREAEDVDAVWGALASGALLGVSSGHVAVSAASKATPYPRTPPGMPAVGSWLPLLLDRASRGEISLVQVARWASEAPAALLGLKRSGRVEVGFDADLVLIDPDADVSLPPLGAGWSGWSPFGGFSLRGNPVMTILRGTPVYRDGRLLDGTRGRTLTYARSG